MLISHQVLFFNLLLIWHQVPIFNIGSGRDVE